MLNSPVFLAVAVIIGSFLIGSVSFAIIFTKLFSNKDVRDFGSGNAGMTNVMRVSGPLPGILTFVFDFLKGFVAAYIGGIAFERIFEETENIIFSPIYGKLICALFCMIGHVLPIFFSFRGGKGVATGVGAFFAVCPVAAASGLGIFAVLFIITRIISLSSLAGTAAVVLVFDFFYLDSTAPILPQIIIGMLIAFIIFAKHKENIFRLIHGEEKKLKVKKK